MVGSLGLPELAFIVVVAAFWLLVIGFPAARICGRLGFPPWLGLVAIVPVANLILLFYIAFAAWPAMPFGEGRQRP